MFVLFVPWILLILLATTIILLFTKKRKYSTVTLLSIVILNFWSESIPPRLWSINKVSTRQGVSLLCFNIDGNKDDAGKRMPEVAELLLSIDSDVVFLSEFSEVDRNILDECLTEVYPFSTYIWNLGHCFYSKYPLSPQQILVGNDGVVGIYSTSLAIGNDTVFLYGCHLASNNYTENDDYLLPEDIVDYHSLRTYLKDIDLASQKRKMEAAVLRNDMKEKTKVIVMGDMNDVGGAPVIKVLEAAGLKDAWWEGGVGYGATIHKPLPYRIDHILFSKDFCLQRVRVVDNKRLSDHDAIYAYVGFE